MITKICKLKDCTRNLYAQSLCGTHYRRAKISGLIVNIRKDKHGLSRIPEYQVWRDMKSRCYNPTCKNYKHYGARGITVCKRWLDNSANFLTDMGKRPNSNYSLDRINNNGNYEPNNCRWATMTVQILNRRPVSNTTSGIRGIYWNKTRMKWQASICINGNNIFLGRFDDLKEASEVRHQAEVKYHLPILSKSLLHDSIFQS